MVRRLKTFCLRKNKQYLKIYTTLSHNTHEEISLHDHKYNGHFQSLLCDTVMVFASSGFFHLGKVLSKDLWPNLNCSISVGISFLTCHLWKQVKISLFRLAIFQMLALEDGGRVIFHLKHTLSFQPTYYPPQFVAAR